MTSSQPSSEQPSHSLSSAPAQDMAVIWSNARRLYPIYTEVAREFAIDLPACSDLEVGADSPGPESVAQAQQWLGELDEKIQVHQLRQFLQTSSFVNQDGIVAMVQHLLAKTPKSDAVRDKVDFLLVQYFSQNAPTDLDDNSADIAYIARGLEPVVGEVELKTPVWLNALDRVLEGARRCRSLDELLHSGILEQGRKAKLQAGELFYLPVALAAFTRFGYLMRRVFFRLMLADLNNILDGLTELEEKGVETIDCRRAQFSAQEPVNRLRMICQSWKVMFQAEYSSGQPLRMLVDLRASVDGALGRGASANNGSAAKAAANKGKAAAPAKASAAPRAAAAAAGAGAGASATTSKVTHSSPHPNAHPKPGTLRVATKAAAEPVVTSGEAPEFEISAEPQDWDPDTNSQAAKKK
jgi:hypothetical protein